MAIDNSWLSLYWETGLLAVAIVGIAFIVAWISVLRAPTPYIKAAAPSSSATSQWLPSTRAASPT